jgi:hypothetical protein
VLIASVYLRFAVADGRPKVIVAEASRRPQPGRAYGNPTEPASPMVALLRTPSPAFAALERHSQVGRLIQASDLANHAGLFALLRTF